MRDFTANHVLLRSSEQKVGSSNLLTAIAVQDLHPLGSCIDLHDGLRALPSLVSIEVGG
jgi:hypothetical protein